MLNHLNGKNVFIFDTETTGLPERVPNAQWGTINEYWLYSMNEKYDKSRIVSIAWSSHALFSNITLLDEKIHHFIRQPEGFNEIPTTHIHGITIDIAKTSGLPFIDIFENNSLYDAIINSDYIIAHNVYFDIHILLNELYRLNTDKSKKTILHIQSLLSLQRCICTCNIGKNICKLEFSKVTNQYKHAKKAYKRPKLSELYKHYYGSEMDNAHSADGDVKALTLCLLKMLII